MGWCAKTWRRRVESEVLARYPGIYIVMARAYDRQHVVRSATQADLVIPGIVRPEASGDPLRALRAWLRDGGYSGPDTLFVQYHPLGGFSWTSTSG